MLGHLTAQHVVLISTSAGCPNNDQYFSWGGGGGGGGGGPGNGLLSTQTKEQKTASAVVVTYTLLQFVYRHLIGIEQGTLYLMCTLH